MGNVKVDIFRQTVNGINVITLKSNTVLKTPDIVFKGEFPDSVINRWKNLLEQTPSNTPYRVGLAFQYENGNVPIVFNGVNGPLEGGKANGTTEYAGGGARIHLSDGRQSGANPYANGITFEANIRTPLIRINVKQNLQDYRNLGFVDKDVFVFTTTLDEMAHAISSGDGFLINGHQGVASAYMNKEFDGFFKPDDVLYDDINFMVFDALKGSKLTTDGGKLYLANRAYAFSNSPELIRVRLEKTQKGMTEAIRSIARAKIPRGSSSAAIIPQSGESFEGFVVETLGLVSRVIPFSQLGAYSARRWVVNWVAVILCSGRYFLSA